MMPGARVSRKVMAVVAILVVIGLVLAMVAAPAAVTTRL
jgi:hypothetical protein